MLAKELRKVLRELNKNMYIVLIPILFSSLRMATSSIASSARFKVPPCLRGMYSRACALLSIQENCDSYNFATRLEVPEDVWRVQNLPFAYANRARSVVVRRGCTLHAFADKFCTYESYLDTFSNIFPKPSYMPGKFFDFRDSNADNLSMFSKSIPIFHTKSVYFR